MAPSVVGSVELSGELLGCGDESEEVELLATGVMIWIVPGFVPEG